jgi:DNA-binding PadR family transcriptional regulator
MSPERAAEPEEMSPTAYVILGMLEASPRSGYEIKAQVEGSTRFFWAASYGQIYPELKRLERSGLIEGTSSPQGGRKRTIYELTAEGREKLRSWLRSPPQPPELRDEGLLKLFFSGAADPQDAARTLREMRDSHLQIVDRLLEIEPRAASGGGYPHIVLRFGIEYHRWVAEACERLRDEVLSQPGRERVGT